MTSRESRVVLVACRLPVQPATAAGTEWRDAAGGVASLLRAVASSVTERERCVWVGGAGERGAPTPEPSWRGTELVAVSLPRQVYRDFRDGYANQVLWPVYHGFPTHCEPSGRLWEAYRAANEEFARAALTRLPDAGTCWVHDYQLQLVPRLVRAARPHARIGWCLYVPFPPAARFRALPHWERMLDGLLGADLLGFQTDTDRHNFLDVAASRHRVDGDVVTVARREVRVGTFPCSIDVADVEGRARAPQTHRAAAALRARLGDPRLVLASAERLDYTKGVDRRLAVLRDLLRDGLLPEGTAIVQVAEPSRQGVASYRDYAATVSDLVEQINAESPSRPLTYIDHHLDTHAMSALYCASDVVMVTSLRDGMNLVAKEYVASRLEGTGALVLSTGAGAAEELVDAHLVDPDDLGSIRAGILAAVAATMSGDDAVRMARLRASVRGNDVHRWRDSFVSALEPRR